MKINCTRIIQAPAEALWSYLGDYANIHRFHPMLKNNGSHFIEGTTSCEIGSTRQCDFKDGNFLKERVTDWKEGSHYTIEVYETSMPVNSAKATLGVRAIDSQTTEAYMQIEMEPKFKIMQPMMYLMFKYKAGAGVLKGLEKIYQEENEPVGIS